MVVRIPGNSREPLGLRDTKWMHSRGAGIKKAQKSTGFTKKKSRIQVDLGSSLSSAAKQLYN